MKKALFTLVLLFFTISSFSQKLTFETSFEAAKAKAQASGKKVLVYIAPNIAPRPTAPNIKVIIPLFIEEPQSIEVINKNFVVYKVMSSTDEARKLMSSYSLNILPSYLFYHPNGDIFQKISHKQVYNGSYHNVLLEAIEEAKKPSLSSLKEEFLKEAFNEAKFLALLEKHKNLGITDNTELLNYFVDHLTVRRLVDYKTILFILENSPRVDSRAYKIANSNRHIIDSIYKTEPYNKRVLINNRIINNSMNSAIEEKNFQRANDTRIFIQSTWKENYKEGLKSGNYHMLRYYAAVKDTTSYLREVFNYVDVHILNKSAKEIKEQDEERIKLIVETQKKENSGIDFFTVKQVDSLRKTYVSSEEFNRITDKNGNLVSSSRTYAIIQPGAGADLNEYASQVYETNTQNKSHLARAMVWMQRAIELNKKAEYYHTLSLILYRLGFKTEAQNTISEAIERAKKDNFPTNQYNDLLTKMREGTLG